VVPEVNLEPEAEHQMLLDVALIGVEAVLALVAQFVLFGRVELVGHHRSHQRV
jgi:hypothetical protein